MKKLLLLLLISHPQIIFAQKKERTIPINPWFNEKGTYLVQGTFVAKDSAIYLLHGSTSEIRINLKNHPTKGETEYDSTFCIQIQQPCRWKCQAQLKVTYNPFKQPNSQMPRDGTSIPKIKSCPAGDTI